MWFEKMVFRGAGRGNRTRAITGDDHVYTDAAPIGIFQTDADNRYVYTNARWSEITGVTADEAVGRDWSMLKPMILNVLMEHFSTGQPVMLAGPEKEAGADKEEDELSTLWQNQYFFDSLKKITRQLSNVA